MKAGIEVLKALTVVLIICAFIAADALFKGNIDFHVFAARAGLFGALAWGCAYIVGRYEHEKDR